MTLQELIPKYHFSEKHHVMTDARPSQLFKSMINIDMSSSPIVRLLFYLRRMPKSSLTLNGMKEVGFTVLGSNRDKEFVIGLVGRFWKPIPQIIGVPPERFTTFNESGYAKAAINFLIEETGKGNQLSTETRIYCTSSGAKMAFSAYWMLIRPFSGLIRKAMLRSIVKGAKQYAT